MAHRRQRQTTRALANGLGWFSIGLGLVELVAAKRLARALGLRGQESLIQAYGLREIGNGIGILASRDKTPWLWGRVGGDALDLATLASGLDGRHRQNVGVAMAAVAGVTALDVVCAQQLTAERYGRRAPRRDYTRRSGFPKGVDAVRGIARDAIPQDFQEPAAMRPPGWEERRVH